MYFIKDISLNSSDISFTTNVFLLIFRKEVTMASPEERQMIHRNVLLHFIKTGRAPHYTEVAERMKIKPQKARQIIRQTVQESPFSFAWMVPDTDYIASWALFSSLPNHHLVSVDGVQKWYGQ